MNTLATNLERSSVVGNRKEGTGTNWITCADGFFLSVVTGWASYCLPRPDFRSGIDQSDEGPFTHAEVGFPSERPEPWDVWEEYCDDPEKPTQTVYGYVPADVIRALIEIHGGEVEPTE